MRLTDLNPEFLRLKREPKPDATFGDDSGRNLQTVYVTVDKIEEAQGIEFLCPVCFLKNKGAVGTHAIICWSKNRGIPDDESPKPGRWAITGTGFNDLTLDGENGKSRSVLLLGGGCKAHFFVTKGEIQIC